MSCTCFPEKIHPAVTLPFVTKSVGYKKKLRGLSPQANYTDRAAAAGRRS